MTRSFRPTSVESLKRIAKAISRAEGLPHHLALDRAAQDAGFANFFHFRGSFGGGETLPDYESFPPRPPTPGLGREAFLKDCREAWTKTFDLLAGRAEHRTFNGAAEILEALQRILRHTRCHTHLPAGGGMDFRSVGRATEPGCLEFQVESDFVYVARPETLIIEHLLHAPAESFALLELGRLAPSPVYEPPYASDSRLLRYEEVVDIPGEPYRDRSVWDAGTLGYGDDGSEILLPEEARLMVRWFGGKMLFVTKGSRWNGTSSTYDGRHDKMRAGDIRAMIERSLKRAAAPELQPRET